MSGILPSTPTTQQERPFALTARWVSARAVLMIMTLLELGWLGAIWITGATAATYKLLPLMVITIIFGVAVIFLPNLKLNWPGFDEAYLAQRERWILFFLALLFGTVLIYFASQQRVWTFDEEGNMRAASVVAEEGIQALFNNYDRFPWLGRQHPPLAPIIYGLGMKLFGVSQLGGRLVTAVFALGNGWLTYLIGRRLYDRKTAFLGAMLLFSFPLVFRLGAAAMVETMLTFFFTLTVLLTLWLIERPSFWRLLPLGTVVGIGLLSKYTMVFVLPLVLGIVAIKGTFKQAVRYFGAMVLIGALLLAAWLLYANQLDVLQSQIATVWEYAGLVLTNEYGRRVLFETMTNRLPSGIGVYNLPLLALGILLVVNRRRKVDLTLIIWILSVWLPLSLTLPDHRYFLPSFPAVALVAALGLQQVPNGSARGLLLALLLAGSTLYLYVDWVRAAELFVK